MQSKIQVKIIVKDNICLFLKKIWVKKICGPKNIRVKTIKIFGSKTFSGQKFFWIEQFFWSKNFPVKKISGQKNFCVKKILGQIFFWSYRFGFEIFLSKKKVGLTQGEGYMIPTQKILGLKFCWVVLSCPKRFFVKKKNIRRVNPSRGGVDDPPPSQKIVGLKLCRIVQFGLVRSPTKFQTTRTFISSRSRVHGGGGVEGGVNSNNRVKPNQVEVRLS